MKTNGIPSKKPLHHEAHTAPTKYGMGDYYGTGVKAKLGRMRGDSVGFIPATKKQLGTPPKGLA